MFKNWAVMRISQKQGPSQWLPTVAAVDKCFTKVLKYNRPILQKYGLHSHVSNAVCRTGLQIKNTGVQSLPFSVGVTVAR